ncbi:MAG TPA: NAD-dependent epimerase/dehydratase family protein [Acidimicrobiales bacterium]|nr:NAD-dependent epimerase/dehydratase family protein [Acidimicrobiales bacterium]
MKALVTGGAGFIGSNLADALLARGDDVVVLDDCSTGLRDNVPAGARFVDGSITDPAAVADAVAGVDVVFHQGARGSVPRSIADPVATEQVNSGGTLNVLLAARDAGVRRVVCASSSSVYGGAAPMPTVEASPLLPKSPYAISKLTGEHHARVFSELFGVETVSLRYFNVFGPRQRPDSQYAAVIPLFLAAVTEGRDPEVHGDGEQTRDFTFIEDVVAANIAAAESSASGIAVNIAGGQPRSILGVLHAIEAAVGRTTTPTHTPPRAGDVRASWADVTLAADALGWRATVPFEDGIARTVEWFLSRSH